MYCISTENVDPGRVNFEQCVWVNVMFLHSFPRISEWCNFDQHQFKITCAWDLKWKNPLRYAHIWFVYHKSKKSGALNRVLLLQAIFHHIYNLLLKSKHLYGPTRANPNEAQKKFRQPDECDAILSFDKISFLSNLFMKFSEFVLWGLIFHTFSICFWKNSRHFL